MASLVDAIRARHEMLAGRVITVPEWLVDGRPVEIHASAFTLEDRAHASRWAGADQTEFALRVIQHKAKDASGRPLLDRADLPVVRELIEAAVLHRVAAVIMEAPPAGTDPVEDAEGN